MRGTDVVPPAVAFDGWQRAWLAVPEVASFVAGSCERGRLHVDDGVEATVADGELILTPRGHAASPAALATGIAARLESSCACGMPGPTLALSQSPLVPSSSLG